jgi:exodeoxyribonuclease V beta subunit
VSQQSHAQSHADRVLDKLDGKDHDEHSAAIETAKAARERVTLADFPGGTTTGNLFHSLLEHCDFQATNHEELVRNKLREFGFAPEHQVVVKRALLEVLATRFGEGVSLSDVARPQRLDELEFTLPCRHGHEQGSAFTAHALADAFERYPSPVLPNSYAQQLASLGFAPLQGYLKGFVDLIFTHQGRWYLVDYKTNDLGDAYPDYDASAMQRAMTSSHYVLQYHLYLLALHRYLKFRLRGYNYDEHMAGAYYLFLRGMHPEHSPSSGYGVFFEKPPLERIERLGFVLDSEESTSPGFRAATEGM